MSPHLSTHHLKPTHCIFLLTWQNEIKVICSGCAQRTNFYGNEHHSWMHGVCGEPQLSYLATKMLKEPCRYSNFWQYPQTTLQIFRSMDDGFPDIESTVLSFIRLCRTGTSLQLRVFKLQRNALDSTWDLQVVLLWGRCWHWSGVPCGIIDSLSMSILCCQYLCRIAEICIFKSLVLPVLLKGWNLQLEELDSCLCSEVPMKNHGIPLEQLYVTPVITCEMDSKLTTCTVHECHLWQYGKVACHVTKRIPSWRPLDKLLLSEIINLCIALKELILNVWRCAPQCGCLIDFRQKMLCIYDKFDIYSAADNLFS